MSLNRKKVFQSVIGFAIAAAVSSSELRQVDGIAPNTDVRTHLTCNPESAR